MRTIGIRIVALAVAAAVLLPAAACATNGYFAHGVGIKAKGMAGAGVAYPQDALTGGSNPAGFAFIGDRFDVGVDWFRPDRGSEISGHPGPGVDGSYDANDEQSFFVPELGVSKALNDQWSIGLSVFGNGGMNTSYTEPIPLFDGTMTTNAGVDLSQLFIVPAVAFKLNEMSAFGIGVNVGWQRFKATGLSNFDAVGPSADPGSVTDNGYDTSTGFGVRVGWIGRTESGVALGASFQSRTAMSEFDEYSGLFAEQGDFDIPGSFSAGVALTPNERTVIAVDMAHTWYGDVKSIANPLLPNLGMSKLGNDDGAGFGWHDVTTLKIGAAYDVSDALTLRGGYNYGGQPIPTSETLFNMLAPGVVEHHATLGGTWRMSDTMELSFAYVHAFENTVEGEDSIPVGFGWGEVDLTMSQDSFAVAFGMAY